MAAIGSGNPGLGVPDPGVGPLYTSEAPGVDPAAKPTILTTLRPPGDQWACAACTLFNQPAATSCAACEAPRPSTGAGRGQREEHRRHCHRRVAAPCLVESTTRHSIEAGLARCRPGFPDSIHASGRRLECAPGIPCVHAFVHGFCSLCQNFGFCPLCPHTWTYI